LKNIVLIGNPNCGKSTLFNRLTGLGQKTSNLPGTTVDSYQGEIELNGETINLIDLPGIYSLFTSTEYEHVVISHLLGDHGNRPDGIVFVLDASNLRRNLLLLSQVAELKIPATCILTMNDTAKRRNIGINLSEFQELLGLDILPYNPRNDDKTDALFDNLGKLKIGHRIYKTPEFEERLLEHFKGNKIRGLSTETLNRYGSIDGVIKKISFKKTNKYSFNTLKIDRVATHPVYGIFIFFLIILALFQGVFTLAKYPMDLIEIGFSWLKSEASAHLPNGYVGDFVQNGLISGLEGVVIFVPQIFILFFLIGILEDSGYMVRASFISDRIMRKIGLNGRSIIPLIGGFACSIPSILAARTIRNKRERLATMLITPLMSCSARLPVYVLLISIIIPTSVFWGPVPAQTLLMTLAYFAGIILALIIAIIFQLFNKKKQDSEFILELPTYQSPRLQTVLHSAWIKCKSFLNEAGKVIIIISMVLWALSSFGPENAKIEAIKESQIAALQNDPDSANIRKSLLLEASYAGHIGKFIEPAIKPLGYDWKTGIALITSFAAREVFVGTMSTLFQAGEDGENVVGIRDKMQSEIDLDTGKPKYGAPYAISLILFYAFALQCMSTMAVLKKETGTWKWSIILFFGYGTIAYISAFIAFNIFS
jgi:ferrous iron transport protein B